MANDIDIIYNLDRKYNNNMEITYNISYFLNCIHFY